MELTFLGTGAAVAPHAYNVALLVDRIVLLDAGAPLSVHLPRAGVAVQQPRLVFLSHFHADHTFGLAWLILARILEDAAPPSLAIVGPAGTRAHVTQLLDFAWGPEILEMAIDRRQVEVHELAAGEPIELEGYRATAYPMTHTRRFDCFGYLLERGSIRLGYSGDAERSAGLDALVAASNHAVVEMTLKKPGPMHLSKDEVEELVRRHPSVKFILTHLGQDASLDGTVAAHDFLTLHLPLR